MALIMGQISVPATKATLVLVLPPGNSDVTVFCTAASLIYLGTGNTVSNTTGTMVPTTPLRWNNYQANSPSTVYAYNTASTSSAFNYILSTQQS